MIAANSLHNPFLIQRVKDKEVNPNFFFFAYEIFASKVTSETKRNKLQAIFAQKKNNMRELKLLFVVLHRVCVFL
jgi:hypothetical protein